MEDDYIFVEGNRYISAKRAAEITGYTSDYIGQMAREGKVRSKKIGRIRFVEEGELKNYTIDSDRKKKAVERLVESKVQTPLVVNTSVISEYTAPHLSESEVSPAPYSVTSDFSEELSPESSIDISTDNGEEPEEVMVSNTISDNDVPPHAPIRLNINEWDLESVASKVGAMAVAVLIVFGPYIVKESGAWAAVKESVMVSYESIKFDAETTSLAIYEKVQTDGWTDLVFDSLAYVEMGTRDVLATSFSGYIRFGEFLRNIPESFDANQGDSVYNRMLGSVGEALDSIIKTLGL